MEGVFPLTDSAGRPLLSAGSRAVTFRISWNDAERLLRCPFAMTATEKAAAEKRALKTMSHNNPFIAVCDYRQGELLVHDTVGGLQWADVIVEDMPQGEPLLQFTRSRLFSSDRKPFRELLRGIAAMSESLHADGIVHGNLRPENIIAAPGGTLIAINYALSAEDNPEADILALASAAMTIFVAACEPGLYSFSDGTGIFSENRLKNMAAAVRTHAEFHKIIPLAELSAAVAAPEKYTPPKLNAVLDDIAGIPFAPMPLLAGLLSEETIAEFPAGRATAAFAIQQAGDPTLLVNFRECEYAGELSDTLIRFKDRYGWDYADRYGKRFTTAHFLDACDFYEGRAAVETTAGWGLIDRQGEYVMPLGFELLEWYGPANVAAASHEGKWELYDRTGRQLTSGGYDWIGDCSEGILLVRRGNKFGYLLPDGTQLTGMSFDDAYSFRDGRALVSSGRSTFYIDRQGNKI